MHVFRKDVTWLNLERNELQPLLIVNVWNSKRKTNKLWETHYYDCLIVNFNLLGTRLQNTLNWIHINLIIIIGHWSQKGSLGWGCHDHRHFDCTILNDECFFLSSYREHSLLCVGILKELNNKAIWLIIDDFSYYSNIIHR